MAPIRVALLGVGNCAAALVQGVQYHRDAPDTGFVPGLMHPRLGAYHVRDVEFAAASAYLMKSPPEAWSDDVARDRLERYIAGD